MSVILSLSKDDAGRETDHEAQVSSIMAAALLP